jgi:transposase
LGISEKEELERILELNPLLALGYRLKERFRELVACRDPTGLDRWIEEADKSGLATFKSLAKTFRHDYAAIRAALTTPWSTAQVEGQNTRVKLIKRLGYGRAKLDLLQARILHRAAA